MSASVGTGVGVSVAVAFGVGVLVAVAFGVGVLVAVAFGVEDLAGGTTRVGPRVARAAGDVAVGTTVDCSTPTVAGGDGCLGGPAGAGLGVGVSVVPVQADIISRSPNRITSFIWR